MCLSYRFRLSSTSSISSDIQKNAVEILKARIEMSKANRVLNGYFKQLKKENSKLAKFSPGREETRGKRIVIIPSDRAEKAAVRGISALVLHDVIYLLREIDAVGLSLKRIILDADTILYRESKQLDRFHQQVSIFTDESVSSRLMAQLNLLKEEMKTTARKLYELSKETALIKKPFKKKKSFPVSKEVAKLSIEAADLEKILENLKITKIVEITKDAEKELDDLKKIEVAVASLIPELKSNISHVKNELYLVEQSAARRIQDRLAHSEKKIEGILKTMTSNAEKLLEDIVILKRI